MMAVVEGRDFGVVDSGNDDRVILSKSETHGDFNNGSKSECFTTENTPKKPRTQRLASPKPDTNVNGETPGILSKSETQGDFNNGSKSEIFRTENTPKKPRTQRLASPKPDTNANGETPVNLSNNESLIKGKVPITKAIKKLRFILNGKELKSPAKRTHTSVSKNNEKPQPPKRRRRTKLHVPPSPPDLPEDIGNHIREMHRTQEVFVIQKSLYESDVKRDKKKVADKDLCMALVVVDRRGSRSSGSSNDREGGNNSSRGSEGIDSNGSSRDARINSIVS
ncbi:hypothetical protein SO802_011068 [Lithocarpus litseifolius]|uniref:Uncharacterized protein n=1 Tax=Lithocarpus litseifolius TaxID=425828 RepID=A0AAW2DGJ4_9ROSI